MSTLHIAVRKETKNKWERRTPLSPSGVAELAKAGIPVSVEESQVRVYPSEDYRQAGATIVGTTDDAQVVVGIKEPPLETIREGQVHMAFAHVIKGQPYNMPLLKALLERGCTLIDYEPMVDDAGKRVAAVFSRFAGISGTIETLRVAALKLELNGVSSALASLKQPWQYGRLEHALAALRQIAPFQENLRLLIVGAGNVGQGCVMICNELGIPQLPAAALDADQAPDGPWYAVVDAAEIVRARDGRPFQFAEYVELGNELYDSTFHRFLGKFDILLQGAYWDERYPRQLPLALIKQRGEDLPWVIGDISCDIEGTLECTTQATSIDEPAFTYNVARMTSEPGIAWSGPTIMAIDNLPCELPADASDEFSKLLVGCLPYVARADLSKPLEASGLTPERQRGTIVYKGELTPRFRYLQQYV